MKVIYYLLVMIFLTSINVMAQSQIDIIDKSVNPGETLTEIPMEPLATKGHYFLNDEWLVGNIFLKNNLSIKNRFIKYDIENKHLEIKVDDEIKVLKIDRVKDFELYDNGFIKKFTNSYSYKLADNSRLIGVFEVLAEGKIKLFCKTEIELIKSNYVAAIDMGSKADKISKRRDLYIYKDEKVYPLPKNKNNLLALLIDQDIEAEDFIKREKLRLNKENDLVKLVQFLNH